MQCFHQIGMPDHRPGIFRVLFWVVFAGRLPRGDGRYPSHSSSGGSQGQSWDRYPSSRESSTRRYPSPGRYSGPPERYREGYRPPGHGRYGEDHRHYKRDNRSSNYWHDCGHMPERFAERSSGSSEGRKASKDLNTKGLGVPATNPTQLASGSYVT